MSKKWEIKIKGKHRSFWIRKDQFLQQQQKVTYVREVVNKHHTNEEVNRTRITAGGNLLSFQGDVSIETAHLETVTMGLIVSSGLLMQHLWPLISAIYT